VKISCQHEIGLALQKRQQAISFPKKAEALRFLLCIYTAAQAWQQQQPRQPRGQTKRKGACIVNEAQLGCAHALTVHHIPFFARQFPHELENKWKCDIPQAFCMLSENLVNSQPYPWALLALCLSQVEVGPHLNQCLCRCRIACSHSCGANSCDRSSSCLLLSQLLLLQHGRH